MHAKFEFRSFTRSRGNMGYPKTIGQSLDMPTLPFLQNFNAILFGWTLGIYWPNLRSVAFPAPEIIGLPKNFGQSLDTPTLPFLQNFHGLLFGRTLLLFGPNLKSCSFTRSWDNSDWSFGWGGNPDLGEGEAVGDHWKERGWVPIRPHSNFSSISLRVSEILPFLCSSKLFFPPHL